MSLQQHSQLVPQLVGSSFKRLLGQDIGDVHQSLKVSFPRAIQGPKEAIVPNNQQKSIHLLVRPEVSCWIEKSASSIAPLWLKVNRLPPLCEGSPSSSSLSLNSVSLAVLRLASASPVAASSGVGSSTWRMASKCSKVSPVPFFTLLYIRRSSWNLMRNLSGPLLQFRLAISLASALNTLAFRLLNRALRRPIVLMRSSSISTSPSVHLQRALLCIVEEEASKVSGEESL